MNKYAIIVAGGSGTRMKSDVPKQFLEIAGKPVIVHTVEAFLELVDEIILVLPKEHFELWDHLKDKFALSSYRIEVVEGGSTRFDSVKNGLSEIYQEDGLVAVHDAVRPFISDIVIEKSFQKALEKGSGVVAVPLKDSVRRIKDGHSQALDRSEYYLMQTPQTFRLPLLKKAYLNASEPFTDDAAVYEADGHTVEVIEGEYENIKITTPEDMYLGEAIFKFQKSLANKLM